MTREDFNAAAIQELDAVYRLAIHLTREPERASDLVQETYLRAFRASERFEMREHGMRPWLFRILKNTYFTTLRKHAWERSARETLNPDDAYTEADVYVASDMSGIDWEQVDDRIKHAIDGLGRNHREVLMLWAVDQFKYREIAGILGVPIGTVMSRLHRARAVLASQLMDLAPAMHAV